MEAKQVKDIMEAYASVYAQPEQEVLSEEVIEEKKKIATGSGKKAMPSKKERSALAKKARAGEDIGKPGKGFKKVAEKAAKQYGSKEAGERVAAAAMFRNEEVETDLFDYLLEYLVAEGYADTNKAALAIIANMSEEWKQSIVEQASTVSSSGGAGGKVTVNKSYPATLNNQKGVKSTGPTGTEYFTPNFPGSNVPNRAEAKFKSVASQQYEKVPSDQRTMDLNKPVSVTDRTKYDPSYKPPGMRK